ncbi:hypothetical protein [Dyadobacter sp. 676]|uniref:Uncharacterized protein n=1 Tax=Dyadobacter sp. 676 TaxID=3088362 RepID=A0AAU8FLL4_9BACT
MGIAWGGLAIRECLQNSDNWPVGDGFHHVAKVITSGTPHGGSEISSWGLVGLLGYDEWSDAARDFRPNIAANYLWGGHEANVPKTYKSQDIDCDGYSGFVVGLNRKSIPMDFKWACIVGVGGITIGGYGGYDDDVVRSHSANVFNYLSVEGDLFVVHNSNQQASDTWEPTWHTKLPQQTFTNHYALDEPEDIEYAYVVSSGQEYKGFLTPPPSGKDFDRDRFTVYLDTRGLVTFRATLPKGASGLFSKRESDFTAPANSKFFILEGGEL